MELEPSRTDVGLISPLDLSTRPLYASMQTGGVSSHGKTDPFFLETASGHESKAMAGGAR